MTSKNRASLIAMLIGLLLAASNFGCGGGSASPPRPISVSLSQTTATVQAGATAQFTATVVNDSANKGVTWIVSCSAASCGSVSPASTPSGAATTYTAPATAPASLLTVTLTATSVADTTKTASASISVPTAPATGSSTIAVGTAPSAIAVDSTNNKIYVADFGTRPALGSIACSPTGADVAVIDGPTESPTTTVGFPGVLNPVAMTLNAASHTVYVVARAWGPPLFTQRGCAWIADDLVAIDTSTLNTTVIFHKLTLGHLGFLGVDVNQATSDIYLTDAGTFPATTNSVIVLGSDAATIPVGTKPIGISINAATNKIYVANSGSNDISVIDAASNSVVATITDSNALSPTAVAVNPATNIIYVANSQSNNVSVIDGATGSVTATIAVGTSPSGVAVDEQTNFIYVANAGNSQNGDPGNVTVINGATNATTILTDPKAMNPVAVAANPVTNKIYVANSGSNNVTVIDGAH